MKSLPMLLVWAAMLPLRAAGETALQAPNWDAGLAVQTAQVPAAEAEVRELFALLRSGDAAALEDRLDAVIAGGSLSQPARDSILFDFTVGLAEFEAVDPDIIERLRSVKPSVLVPHEERADVGVPLFNVAGAAEGVRQLFLRREARVQASRTLAGPPAGWVDAYLLAPRAARLGFADALGEAPQGALRGILDTTLVRLPESTELTPVAGKSALLLRDEVALEQVARFGGGSELASILEAAALTLSPGEGLALLQYAVAEAPPANAALAVARLYPALSSHPEATALLFDRLADAGLGGAAALALARAGDAEAHRRLQEVARGNGPAAVRARTALDLHPRHAVPER